MTVAVIHGEAIQALRDIPSGTVGAVIADPPYSSGGTFVRQRQQASTEKYVSSDSRRRLAVPGFEGESRDQRSYLAWSHLWMLEAYRILGGGHAIACFTDWRQLPVITDAVQAAGFTWRGIAVWDKTRGRPGPGIATGQTEFIVWGTKGPNTLRHVHLPGILSYRIERDDHHHHQTPKPVALMARLCELAPPGSTVVDPFTGSGSLLVAASRVGRDAIGVEMASVYAEAARQRLADACAQARMFEVAR